MTRGFRLVALVAVAIGTVFWLYTFYHIASLPAGDGTGFQWMGAVPLAGIFAICIVPSFFIALSGRTPVVAAALSVGGLVLFALLWMQLLSEFAPG